MPRKTTKKRVVKKPRKKTTRTKRLEIQRMKPITIKKKESVVKEKPVTVEPDVEYVFDVPQEEVNVQEAPFWRRALAYIIDVIFFYFILFQIFMWIYLPQVGLAFTDFNAMQAYIAASPSAQMRVVVGFTAALFIFLFYFMLLEKNFKTTIGKKIMKLQIVGKEELSYWDVFIRNITKTVLIYFFPLDLIGWVFFKQRYTERLTGTKVIYYSQLSLEYGSW